VYVHPFAEEMNKARRMAAIQSRAFAQRGHAVLRMDLLGCGDSAGDFGDATWQAWVQDVQDACALGVRRHQLDWPGEPAPELWLWGLRAGCLLAVAAAGALTQSSHFVFWQPQVSGKLALQQFLRLKMAASLDGDSRAVTEQVRRDLAEGRPVEVAGYTVAAALAAGLEQAELAPPPRPGRARWLELRASEPAALLPATAAAAQRWQAAGWDVTASVVPGPAFWSTVEVEQAPALVDATSAALATETTA
jgi:exosortase A-associated hydrolase 2